MLSSQFVPYLLFELVGEWRHDAGEFLQGLPVGEATFVISMQRYNV